MSCQWASAVLLLFNNDFKNNSLLLALLRADEIALLLEDLKKGKFWILKALHDLKIGYFDSLSTEINLSTTAV